jgi:hypothetical protein
VACTRAAPGLPTHGRGVPRFPVGPRHPTGRGAGGRQARPSTGGPARPGRRHRAASPAAGTGCAPGKWATAGRRGPALCRQAPRAQSRGARSGSRSLRGRRRSGGPAAGRRGPAAGGRKAPAAGSRARRRPAAPGRSRPGCRTGGIPSPCPDPRARPARPWSACPPPGRRASPARWPAGDAGYAPRRRARAGQGSGRAGPQSPLYGPEYKRGKVRFCPQHVRGRTRPECEQAMSARSLP